MTDEKDVANTGADEAETKGEVKAEVELLNILGRRAAKITIGEHTITLRPLTLNDQCEFYQEIGSLLEHAFTPVGQRFTLWLMARRGGYKGSPEDLGGLIEIADLTVIDQAMRYVIEGGGGGGVAGEGDASGEAPDTDRGVTAD